VDVCAPIQKDRDSDNNANQPVINSTTNGNSHNASKTVSYGLQRHRQPTLPEYILVVWVFTLLCEEIRQVIYCNK
jgi:hypothetical protein